MLQVLNINTSDIYGGAARAAYRLHKGLSQSGLIESAMLVQNKCSDDYTVYGPKYKIQKAFSKMRPFIDKLPLKLYRKNDYPPWGLGWIPSQIDKELHRIKPDIVNLHWICGGFISISSIAHINYPVIWTLHDSWAFTGGCHIPFDCYGYLENCGKCPQLNSLSKVDLSNIIWRYKQKIYKKKNMIIVSPSTWLEKCVKQSSLLGETEIEVIPNGIDTNIYKPVDKKFARDILGLPQDKKIILFGAMDSTSDKNKGFHFLQPALQRFSDKYCTSNVRLVVFGASTPKEPINFCYPVSYAGCLNDDYSLVLLYSAADVFIAPSIMDNLPNTIIEAMACGTPCIAFDIGGIPDIIKHKHSGYLAKAFNTEDLADGIAWVLADERHWESVSSNARKRILQNFDINIIAGRYIALYERALDKQSKEV